MREFIRKLKSEQEHKWRDEECEGGYASFVKDFEDAVDRYEAGLDAEIEEYKKQSKEASENHDYIHLDFLSNGISVLEKAKLMLKGRR